MKFNLKKMNLRNKKKQVNNKVITSAFPLSIMPVCEFPLGWVSVCEFCDITCLIEVIYNVMGCRGE